MYCCEYLGGGRWSPKTQAPSAATVTKWESSKKGRRLSLSIINFTSNEKGKSLGNQWLVMLRADASFLARLRHVRRIVFATRVSFRSKDRDREIRWSTREIQLNLQSFV